MGRMVGPLYGGVGRGRVYTYRYTVMTCTKMGSDESHFNVPLIVRDKLSHKTVSTNHNFRRERRAEAVLNRGPSAYQPTALPLGQTGSLKFGTAVSLVL